MNQQPAVRRGPLAGVRVLEFGAIGPAPFAAMMLADMGAEVVRIERDRAPIAEQGATVRGRQLLKLDLKNPSHRDEAFALARHCDILIEGFRPGVMERLGLGPEALLVENPSLIYGRMTGWGQSGPLASMAGHDINYIAIAGALHAIGPRNGPPVVPLNLVGDYGGGALYLVAGLLAAFIEAQRSGLGQVVDAAICDGTVSLMSLFHTLHARGVWTAQRGCNALDGGAPFYRTYECLDGEFLAVGAIEPQFYALLCSLAGWTDKTFDDPSDRSRWPEMADKTEAIMRTRTRGEWMHIFAGTDACVAPVLSLEESRRDPHLVERECFVVVDGENQPAPAPRFSRTPSMARSSTNEAAGHVLTRWLGSPRRTVPGSA